MSRISIAVHGRFHAFDLAAALLRQGIDVQLLTNYPRAIVKRWFPAERTKTLLMHGLLTRAAGKITRGDAPEFLEAAVKRYFGRWAAHKHKKFQPDAAHCWSGVAEETLRARPAAICSVTRGSAHIGAQKRLLVDEQKRVGIPLDQPSDWIVAREEREYHLADRLVVPSAFARDTFLESGVPADKLRIVPLALQAPGFAARAEVIEARLQRLRNDTPLRVLYTGTLSYRKGMHDMQDVLRALGQRMNFRFVGPTLPECEAFARSAARHALIEPAVPQHNLPAIYAWGDVFVLPTIEDGFAVVLAQAQAAGLPILTTTNCGGREIIEGGGQGWIVSIRAADQLISQLEWCDENRDRVAEMVELLHTRPPQRSWDDVAREFIEAVTC
ncbi:MAG TPA: glycosyltransferase family 4 protein [Longimicrobiales bacterium]